MNLTERQNTIVDIKQKLVELAAIDPQDLSREKDFSGQISFKEAVPFMASIRTLIHELNDRREEEYQVLSSSHLKSVLNACKSLGSLVGRIQSFSISVENPLKAKDEIIRQIENEFESTAVNFGNALSILAAVEKSQVFAAQLAEFKTESGKSLETFEEEGTKRWESLREIEEYSKDAMVKIESTLEAAREASAMTAVATVAKTFETEADNCEQTARKWFWGTSGTAVLMIAVAVLFVPGIPLISAALLDEKVSTGQAIQYVLSRLILLSTLSFGVFWCARQYRAQKHNATLNKHRANALKTFRAFVEGADDPQVKDAILLQAAHAAFINRATGYETGDVDVQVNPVMGILEKTFPKAGSGSAT